MDVTAEDDLDVPGIDQEHDQFGSYPDLDHVVEFERVLVDVLEYV